ncbi:MAG TPA: MFS transporter [Solirubrobacteraceae bacterium]|jgi:MFS family permease|nr:MFS transporter [Solirubrobacteraceae bacterium]
MAERSVGASVARGLIRASRWTGRQIRGEVVRRVGGAARARVVVVFGLVLALNGADASTVGAIAPQLKYAFHGTVIGTGGIGLLSSVSLLVGAVATLPVGFFVDRVKRIPLLAVSIVLWSIASLFSAFAGSYGSLLLTRLLLGVVVATAGPAIASLTGDYFPAKERGKIYAYVLGGEIAGTAFGFIISSSLASAISWRAAFFVLAIPGFFLARVLYRTVPEPLRGGQSHLEYGADDLVEAAARARARPRDEWLDPDERPTQIEDIAQQAARRLGAEPDPELILHDDPRRLTLMDSIRYVMRIPTNVMMIISSSLGYFYFAGLQTFALSFVIGHYHVGEATSQLVLALIVLGALIGTLVSGWLADELVRRGYLNSRVWIPGVCYLAAGGLLIPGLVMDKLSSALWFDVAGAALISAANPPLDAARLDIMPAGLWGRAEGVRTFLRSLAQALAPLIFGGIAALIAGIATSNVKTAPIGTKNVSVTPAEASGLEVAFLILLVALLAGGIAMLRARHTYARDVATAGASEQGTGNFPVRPRSGDTRTMRTSGSRTLPVGPTRRDERKGTRRRWD